MVKKYIYIKTCADFASINGKVEICDIRAVFSFDEAVSILEQEAQVHPYFTYKFIKKTHSNDHANSVYDENEGFYHFDTREKTICHEDKVYMHEVRPYLAENNLTKPRYAFIHTSYHTETENLPQIGDLHLFSLRKSAISYMEYYVEEFCQGSVPMSVAYEMETARLKAKYLSTENEETIISCNVPNKYFGMQSFIIIKLN